MERAAARADHTARALALVTRLARACPADPAELAAMLATRLAAGRLRPGGVDWAVVCPTVLGAVRHAVTATPARRAHGEHFTTEENVRKTLDPLILDELRAQLAAAHDEAALRRLWDRLAALRFLDPACGAGNFLVVACREVRAIEAEVRRRLGVAHEPTRVPLEHFHGIELDPWSAALARTALLLLDWQLTGIAGGTGEPGIVTGDALDLDWSAVVPPGEHVVVAGNPPFRGHKERTAAQGAQLRRAWGTSNVKHLDYVTAWFATVVRYFGPHRGRFAFVATNSVAQGESVPELFGPIAKAGWRLSFAHRTFAWGARKSATTAAVHVVILGFSRAPGPARLFDYRSPTGPARERSARHINGYLVDGPDVLVRPADRPLATDLPPIRAGSTAIDWNQFTVGPDDVESVRADPIAARHLRRFVGGRELINDLPRWCLWMAGPDFDPQDVARSPVLRTRVERVRALRAAAQRATTRGLAARPHLFGEIRQPEGAYLAMPQTFAEARSHATAARLDGEVIASVKLFTAPDPDGLLFALFSSAAFLAWQKTVGGRLRSDPSLSASVVWNTFPLPPLAAAQRAALAEAGAAVLSARMSGVSLARQYTPGAMAAPLCEAHTELDALVDKALGSSGRCRDEPARQQLLFARYADLAARPDPPAER
jgi:N-6 DNA Methylase